MGYDARWEWGGALREGGVGRPGAWRERGEALCAEGAWGGALHGGSVGRCFAWRGRGAVLCAEGAWGGPARGGAALGRSAGASRGRG